MAKDPVLVVLQLSGGNDYLNTVIPYSNSLYWDNRPVVNIPEDKIVQLDNKVGFNASMAPIKAFYDEGKMAIIHGVGYANSPRSHFRSMDIWHTCEPDKVGTEGWLGRAIRDIDPNKENVVTGVSFGPSMFRAMAVKGVPVACVSGSLETYGMLPGIEQQRREKVLERFSRAYDFVRELHVHVAKVRVLFLDLFVLRRETKALLIATQVRMAMAVVPPKRSS